MAELMWTETDHKHEDLKCKFFIYEFKRFHLFTELSLKFSALLLCNGHIKDYKKQYYHSLLPSTKYSQKYFMLEQI